MKIISDIKTQKCKNMKVSVTVNDKSYFEQDEFINNADVIKYHELFLESITVGQFRRFDDKSKDNFIKGLYKNENEQKNKNELIRAKLLLDLCSIPESYDYKQIVEFLRENENSQRNFKLTKDKVENLYQKGQLGSCLTNFVIAFNDLLVEIEYPCNEFEQIMKIISDIKTQNGKNLKVSVTINNKSYFEQKYEWNKIVNICKVGKSIDAIPEKGFCDFCDLSDFEISPNRVTIGDSSFKNCTSLAEIKIPASVKSIGDNCFDGCSKLDRVSINPFYTHIQFNTFNKCPSIKHFAISTAREIKSKTSERILIPYNITDIFSQTNFFNSSELTSYINECTEIIFDIRYPSDNFEKLYDIITKFKDANKTKIKISIFIVEKTDKKFQGNKTIDIVRINSSIKEIKSENNNLFSFSDCSSLTQVIFEIQSFITSIGDSAFSKCSSLTQITIPSSVTSIGNKAFDGCSSLTQITIPSSVTSIGEWAFSQCSSLTQVKIPSSVTSIGHRAFFICPSLTQITIPSSVTKIEDQVFYGCSSLKQITIPSSVTSFGSGAFDQCSSLIQITIPSSVTKIGCYAFRGCSKLTQITIPSSVTLIHWDTFSKCSSLTQITIPSSITKIGEGAFRGCSSLTQITIPSSVTSIDNKAFDGCSSLTQITIPSKINRNNLGINSNATINLI